MAKEWTVMSNVWNCDGFYYHLRLIYETILTLTAKIFD